ncbi:hypothetical protein BDY19DRAFT_908765 [Irpex rosettiformis]|uniref:Uncharacterized protein n=1 Tax=Irpex rosettiformis TaxID=378272 RepID=A0ACB8TUV5_9APHY|nr:hypothetical protein BDY19DRAFT_908765 [Irpex rosettiformis]
MFDSSPLPPPVYSRKFYAVYYQVSETGEIVYSGRKQAIVYDPSGCESTRTGEGDPELTVGSDQLALHVYLTQARDILIAEIVSTDVSTASKPLIRYCLEDLVIWLRDIRRSFQLIHTAGCPLGTADIATNLVKIGTISCLPRRPNLTTPLNPAQRSSCPIIWMKVQMTSIGLLTSMLRLKDAIASFQEIIRSCMSRGLELNFDDVVLSSCLLAYNTLIIVGISLRLVPWNYHTRTLIETIEVQVEHRSELLSHVVAALTAPKLHEWLLIRKFPTTRGLKYVQARHPAASVYMLTGYHSHHVFELFSCLISLSLAVSNAIFGTVATVSRKSFSKEQPHKRMDAEFLYTGSAWEYSNPQDMARKQTVDVSLLPPAFGRSIADTYNTSKHDTAYHVWMCCSVASDPNTTKRHAKSLAYRWNIPYY